MKKYAQYKTFVAHYSDGTEEWFYCKKEQIVEFMSAKHFAMLDHMEIINAGGDNVKHRPITKAQLEKYL